MRLHAIDVAADDLIVLAESDLVVLAAPVKQNIATLAELDDYVRTTGRRHRCRQHEARHRSRGCGLPPRFTFIGGHPLAGAARGGLEHARPDIFRAPGLARDGDASVHSRSWRRLFTRSARLPGPITADAHDRLVAFLSHLAATDCQRIDAGRRRGIGEEASALPGAVWPIRRGWPRARQTSGATSSKPTPTKSARRSIR